MKKNMIWLILIASLCILVFTMENSGAIDLDKESSTGTKDSKELKLNIEDVFSDNKSQYRFIGFIGEDTLVFEYNFAEFSSNIYQPAKIGQKFKFKRLKNIEAEIVDYSREEGYVTLNFNSNVVEIGK